MRVITRLFQLGSRAPGPTPVMTLLFAVGRYYSADINVCHYNILCHAIIHYCLSYTIFQIFLTVCKHTRGYIWTVSMRSISEYHSQRSD